MIRSATLKQSQLYFLVSEIEKGIEIQKNAVLRGLHGIYCDSTETQTARVNSLALASSVGRAWPATGKAEILDQHSTFVAFGHDDKEKASNEFLSKLELLASLPEIQRHSLVTRACRLLVGAHEAFNNFYNEPPFAERLAELARQGAVPDSAREVYVRTVIYVGIGNRYGVSHAAQPHYLELVKRFTPLEVAEMLRLPSKDDQIKYKLSLPKPKQQYCIFLRSIEHTTVPASARSMFTEQLKGCRA
jgi:hypothetical protein